MQFNFTIPFVLLAILLFVGLAKAQSVEIYAGNRRTGIDIMWFKKIKNAKEKPTAFLFFSRNRASVNYHNAPTVFASTNAVSYNFKNGLGVVGVASLLYAGLTPKAGIQFYKQKKDFMFFGWLVADIQHKGNIDLFGMFRYQPKINTQLQVFNQLELFTIYNPTTSIWNLTQRIRLGVKCLNWAGGFMTDLNQIGKTNFTTTENVGGFLRYEF